MELHPKSHNRRGANLTGLIKQFTGKNVRAQEEETRLITDLNLVATRRRMKARAPAANSFYQYLARIFNERKLVLCVTDNVDGLETQYCKELGEALVMIRGDNRLLECSTHYCEGLTAQPDYIEAAFLRGERAECPSCSETETGEYQFVFSYVDYPADLVIRRRH